MTKFLLSSFIILTLVSPILAIQWDFSSMFSPPETVKELVVSQYIGRWYQMFGNRLVYSTFETGFCQTADYALKGSNVTILNTQNLERPGGAIDQINGTAIIPDPKEPGQLTAYLNTGLPFTFGAPYWVLKLGPAEKKGNVTQYQYSIVSDPVRASLFVLARDREEFKTKFESDVLKFLSSAGFTNYLNEPVAGVQGSQCKYVAPGEMFKSAKPQEVTYAQLWSKIFN